MKSVLVFKTSVGKEKEVQQIRPSLNKLMQKNEQWNFDLEDCDKILRVETVHLTAKTIKNTLQTFGYQCEEL
ncbi:hypothetical protein JoomaDRAFT_3084 [Galbibacter orientalis DSM 19592]|uniref:HMA domain-containing protein n=1 Tax=Galbibacter orientalis DSM 19592 TaxID=926559 RepID=I3C8U4_9FLAO|nr:hypothetical protein [Galbibacter orientalis]EIJ40037.1 hypothetical protein JoomaDRAFT_3084 [Galbibacter orientalis DSM 19592]